MVAITEDDIRSLAAFKGDGAPVTSVYLDIDGAHHVRWLDVVRAAESLLKDAAAKHGRIASCRPRQGFRGGAPAVP